MSPAKADRDAETFIDITSTRRVAIDLPQTDERQINHFLVVYKDGTSEYVTKDELLARYSEIRIAKKYVLKLGNKDDAISTNGQKTARVYMAVDPDEAKVGMLDSFEHSNIYLLKDYDLTNTGDVHLTTGKRVGESIMAKLDKDGTRYETVKDTLSNPISERYDVYNGKGQLVKSTPPDPQKISHRRERRQQDQQENQERS